MSTPEKNISAVRNFFSTLEKPEHFSLYNSYFHKAHKFNFPFFPQPIGVEDHKKMDEGFVSGFPDCKIVINDLFASDDKVVLRGKFTGTHKGEFNKIPPTGKKINLSFISIVKFKDGKNIEEWVEMDTIKMMRQLGLAPEQ
jgi:predicted ester cyclase